MIEFRDIEVSYDDFVAIPQLNLTIQQGEFFTLLGPSGCGKTTALRTLAGLQAPSSGQILMLGNDVTKLPSHKRHVGMVFQNYALFPSLSVAGNIAFGLDVQKVPRAEREARVQEAAELVELGPEQMDKNLDELSGGQQQRVAIARALVLKPKLLLLDEPLSNLDAKLRQQMRDQLKTLQRDVGITTVYVTHDQDEALALSDRIAVFNQGRVEQVASPHEIYARPASEFVCTFVGESSRLGPELVQHLVNNGARLDPAAPSYLREERASLQESSQAIAVPGRVQASLFHGTHSTALVDLMGSQLRVMQFGQHDVPEGETTVWINPDHVLQFPEAKR